MTMNIQQHTMGRALVLSVHEDRIDSASALQFRELLRGYIDDGNHQLVLDLSKVNFIDSSGLGSLVGAFKYLGQRGTFALAGLTQPVQRLFQLTRMERVFQIYPSPQHAEKDFQ